MQLIVTNSRWTKSHALNLSGLQLLAAFVVAAFVLMVSALALYHWVFLKGARDGWPIIGSLVKLVTKSESEQRDRYLRENLDLMARRMGEMQAKLTQLESLGVRVSGLAGINLSVTPPVSGAGGVLVGGRTLTLDELQVAMDDLEKITHQRLDVFAVLESRLFDQKIKSMMVPTQAPVIGGDVGSSFGWRLDPLSGRSALHTGLDFPALVGTPILAAAGGVVVVQTFHPEYGQMIEVDHGNDLITRYAHASKVWVKKGDLIKRGQKIAEVGSTGRSTGAHLHFEVLVQGVPQDPQKFLSAGQSVRTASLAPTPSSGRTQGVSPRAP